MYQYSARHGPVAKSGDPACRRHCNPV